jgi:hypothetical protein
MVVAPQAVVQAPTASGFDFLSGMGVPSTTAAPPMAANTISPPMPSSFSFMLGGGAATAPEQVAAPAETGFSFLSSAAAPSVAPSASVPTSTLNAFLAAGHADVVPQQVGLLPVVSVDAASATVVPTANIKKKKPGFRPGFAREDGGSTDAPQTGSTSGSLLSGLVVHEEADDAPSHSIPAPSGMLAGLKLHSENVPEEGPSPTAEDTARNVSSFALVSGAPYQESSMLAGLHLHNASESQSNGSMFGGLVQTVPPAGVPASSSSVPPMPSSAIDSNFSDADIERAKPQAPAPGPAPPKVSDPTERMQEILRLLNDAASATRAKLAAVKVRLRSLLDADRKSNADIEVLRERLARVEAQQDEAIKGEHFEAAEALNGTLEGLRSALSAAETGKRQVALERASVESQQHEIFSESLTVVTESVMGLKKYVDDRELLLSKFRREALTKHTATTDRLANEEEQLRLKEEHVELDQKLVEEEKHQVEKAITDQTTELDTQVEQLRNKHTTLAAEVLELEKLLEVKRREGMFSVQHRTSCAPPDSPLFKLFAERTAASQLEDAESRIKQIRSKFDKQSKRLQSKQTAVEAERSECNNEAAALQAAKRDFSSTLVRVSGPAFGRL